MINDGDGTDNDNRILCKKVLKWKLDKKKPRFQ